MVDYLQNQGIASVKVAMESPVPATQGEVFEIDVHVESYGGVDPTPDVLVRLNIPERTALSYVQVDGVDASTNLVQELGTMDEGTGKVVTYGLSCSTLGVKDFSVDVETSLVYRAYDEIQKVIHRADALVDRVLVLDEGDGNAEIEAMKATLEWMGYGVDTRTHLEVINGGIPATYKQAIILNNQEILPTGYSGSAFTDELKLYMAGGGNLALFGNAAELLDLSGITDDFIYSTEL